ncbi:MAG: hypothetical protein RR473_15550, partial [Comamonas sp.]
MNHPDFAARAPSLHPIAAAAFLTCLSALYATPALASDTGTPASEAAITLPAVHVTASPEDALGLSLPS